MDRKAHVWVLEAVAEDRRRMAEAMAKGIAVHEAVRGRLFVARNVQPCLEDGQEISLVLPVPGDQRPDLLAHEVARLQGVGRSREQAIERIVSHRHERPVVLRSRSHPPQRIEIRDTGAEIG